LEGCHGDIFRIFFTLDYVATDDGPQTIDRHAKLFGCFNFGVLRLTWSGHEHVGHTSIVGAVTVQPN